MKAKYLVLPVILLTIGAGCKKKDKSEASSVPVLTTWYISVTNPTTANGGGNITDVGGGSIKGKGLCWSTNTDPTIDDNKTNEGTGTGDFTSSMTGLTPNTTYYVRSYATNSAGTGYGKSLKFKTYTGTVTDIDGNVYNTVTIGSEVWLAENLKVTKYRNGDAIPNVTVNTQWGKITTGAYCNYYHNPTNADTYGRLYNWFAVNDNRNLAPAGYHVATETEYVTLVNYINFQTNGFNLGKILASTSGWLESEEEGDIGNDQASNNSSGFTGVPAGYHSVDDNFYFLKDFAMFWTATEKNSSNAYIRKMEASAGGMPNYDAPKRFGYSVRCVKD